MSGIIGSKLNHRGSGLTGSLGTDGQHLLSAGAGKTNVFETVATADLTGVRQDIATLALHSAVTDNKAAYNLTSSFIDQFQDDTGIGSETTGDRNSAEYWQPSSAVTTAYTSTSGGSIDTSSDDAVTYAIWGAGGGYCPSGAHSNNVAGSGGDGGFVSGVLDTSSISTLYWIVGGAGGNHGSSVGSVGAGGTNGGGAGATDSQYNNSSAGGGGYTGLFSDGSYSRADAYAVAGGGGGNGDGGSFGGLGLDAPDGSDGTNAGTNGANTSSLNGSAGGGDSAAKGGGGGGGYAGVVLVLVLTLMILVVLVELVQILIMLLLQVQQTVKNQLMATQQDTQSLVRLMVVVEKVVV